MPVFIVHPPSTARSPTPPSSPSGKAPAKECVSREPYSRRSETIWSTMLSLRIHLQGSFSVPQQTLQESSKQDSEVCFPPAGQAALSEFVGANSDFRSTRTPILRCTLCFLSFRRGGGGPT